MYQSFYGLSDSAFELTSNSRFVFYTARYLEALNHLENGLSSGRPLTILLGDAGTGKTTILNASLRSDRCRHIRCIWLASSVVTRGELLPALLAELNPHADTGSQVATPLQTIHTTLYQRRSRGIMTALVVDEAETLNDEGLQELCALTTMEGDNIQLLPLVLAGHQALGARLDTLKLGVEARGAQRFELGRLDLSETASYILWRTRAAGAPGGSLFTREAVTLIHELSEGVPRMINVICDNALFRGFFRDTKPVTRATVSEACRRLDLETPRDTAAAPPARTPGRQTAAGKFAGLPGR